MSDKGSPPPEGRGMGEAVDSLTEGTKVFDRYTLMKVVGQGRFSVVWQAWDERLNRDTALKFLPDVVKTDPSALANLKSEVRKLQEIKHAQIVAIDNVEQEGPLVAISTDFVGGATLSGLREQKSDQVFSPAELADWMQQLFTVLEFAHREGLRPHGTLKPSNILLDQKGTLRLSDYGLEPYLLEFVSRTSNRADVAPDLRYMSPQQAAGEPDTVLDDIYAVGVTLYELLTSKPPFYTGDIMLQLQQKIPPPMTHRRKELRVIGEPITRIWEETVVACLSKDPAQRPQSIPQLVEMLEIKAPLAADSGAAPVAPAARPPDSSNKPLVIAGIAAFLIIAAVAGLVIGKKKQPPPSAAPVGTNQMAALSAKQLADLDNQRKVAEAKSKAAEAEAARMIAEANRLKKEEADRAAKAKKAEQDANDRLKAAKEEAARLEAEMKKARSAGAAKAGDIAAAEKALKEAEAKRMAAEAEAKAIVEDAKKRAAEEAKRMALAEKARLEAEAKKSVAMLEAKRLTEAKKDAERRDAERRAAAMKVEEEQRRKADEEKKKADEEKRMAMLIADRDRKAAEAKAKAEAEAKRRFAPGKPWINSLGLKFMPVGKVSFCATETRLSDFEAFYRATRFDAGKGWGNPGFKQSGSEPVVNVNWLDAKAFCKWLTDKERKDGLIDSKQFYRLPTDVEWSMAIGLQNESGSTPAERDGRVKGVYPWGTAWPPSIGSGNFADSVSYDRFEKTAPVASFLPNRSGLYDMAGNVWEWCDDSSDSSEKTRVLRGGSWFGYIPGSLFSSYRRHLAPTERRNDQGFRCVLVSE